MSLKEAYSMAHTAQCRLHMAASEPDRNLRFVVGHLMHYEALRLRIVEIEHDISKSERASAVAFRGTGHVGQQKRSPLSGRKSPSPQAAQYSDEDEDDDPWSGEEDDEPDDDLGLERFPSGAAHPPRPPPDLIPDVDDEDEDEPVSPEEPDQATLEALMQQPADTGLANLYNGIRKCPCHKEQDAPVLEKFWELPADKAQKEGVTRAVAQVWV